jgi:CheY-like chemotaxis protein
MSTPFLVALQGFSGFERSALGSCFRLASQRSPAYEQVEQIADSQFVIADADHAPAVKAVLAAGRVGQTVFIGAHAPAGATAWMMRPIDPLHVMRELDAMVSLNDTERVPLVGLADPLDGVRGGAAGLAPRAVPRPEPAGPVPSRRASDGSFPSSGFIGLAELPASRSTRPSRPAPPPARGHLALLVDDSETVQRALETRLRPLGLQTQRALTSGKAIELLSRQAFDFIFLDVELGEGSEFDGLMLCQHIKRQHRQVGGAASPVVVLLSAHPSELDRVRGTLAGCDAYMAKPLDDALLRVLMRQHGVAPPVAGSALPAL